MRLHKKILVAVKLKCITGLHIGDSKDNVEIGGIDNTVVRRKDNTNRPYIPGSSLKGKIRSLLEQVRGQNADGSSKNNGGEVCELFGSSENGNLKGSQSRIIFRDADFTDETIEMLEDNDFTDMPFTEVKFENTIDRVNGIALNPRKQERVPAGSSFQLNFVLNIFAEDNNEVAVKEKSYLKLLFEGMELLENDYLGGSGSRGYGQVEFYDMNFTQKEFKLTLPNSTDELEITTEKGITEIADEESISEQPTIQHASISISTPDLDIKSMFKEEILFFQDIITV